MKFLSNFSRTLLLALVLHLTSTRAGAQGVGLLAAASTNTIAISNLVTYTIEITNTNTAFPTVSVTNTFTGALPVIFSSPTSTGAGTVTNTTNSVTFFLESVGAPVEEMTFAVEPLALGTLTNTIVVVVSSGLSTNTIESTNVVVSVINTNLSALGVTMSGFPPIAYTGDWVTYDVLVTNAGPAAATDVMFTNSLPTNGVELTNVWPTNASYQMSGSNLVFNLGTLAAGSFDYFQITVQATNTGVFAFSALVGTTNQMNPNPTDEFFTTNLTVTNFLKANLTAFISSTQSFDYLTRHEEQTITLSNGGPATVPASRVIVTGLTNWLSNAVGTNNGNPYVLYDVPLTNGQTANLTMQYYPNYTGFPFTNSQLTAVGISSVDLSPVLTGVTSSNLEVLITNVAGRYLVEFPTMTNRTYAIIYSDMTSTNWMVAQPLFYVPPESANYGFWIDYGPPETLSNSPARMYQVYMYPPMP